MAKHRSEYTNPNLVSKCDRANPLKRISLRLELLTGMALPTDARTGAQIQFVLCSLAMCALVSTVGWLSDLRAVFHGTIIVLSVAAFLPLLVALALVLIFLGMSTIAILSGDPDAAPLASEAYAASEGLAAFFRRVFVPYYRFLFTRRHPTLLGAASGFLLGTLVVGALLSVLVLPGEVCTLKRMAAIQSAIEKRHIPSPLHGQWVHRTALGEQSNGWPFCPAPAVAHDGPSELLLDGFGRRFNYDVAGHWPLTSYRLSSLGYDGKKSGDDLCLSGSSRARAALDRLEDAAGVLHALLTGAAGETGLHRWWSALRGATCPPPP
jgi:hypothetical protein